MDIIKKLEEILKNLEQEIKAVTTEKEVEDLKIKYTGRKSELAGLLGGIGALSPEEKGKVGKEANRVKTKIESLISSALEKVQKEREEAILKDEIDLTFPGRKIEIGRLHPITQMYDEIVKVFSELGFKIVQGPELETDWHCFEMLRMPKDHPARDSQDTYYIEDTEILPRTHTSSCQIRTLMKEKPPIKVLVPGRCYRNEKPGPRHGETFYQFEGLVIDEKTSLKDLKATMTTVLRRLLDDDKIEIRFRHNHFPYTEPSIEIDATCTICGGKGCSTCGRSGWIELCGAGMVHPEVLENFGIDTEKYHGYAFGPGIDRLVMLKYQIPDIRALYENDPRMLSQF